MKFLAALIGICAAVPTAASAHTKWFAQGDLVPVHTAEPVALYLFAWVLIAAGIVAFGIWLQRRRILQLDFIRPRAEHAFDRAAATFAMVTGAFFIIAGAHGYLFSPNLSVDSGIPLMLTTIQIAIGVAFVLGIFARLAALLLGVLWVFAMFAAGFEALLEDVWVLGIAAFVFIMGNDYFSIVSWKVLGRWAKNYTSYALPLLRIGAGTTLIVLGFSEKILRPEYGLNFLALHDWNIIQASGFEWFTDYLFTISAGAVEVIFGLVFVLGIMTRLNALVVAVVFTAPLFILGPMELTGHLPHLAAVVLLLMFGAGEHFRIRSRTH